MSFRVVKLPPVREKRAPVIRGEREPRVREDVEPGAGLPNTARTGGSTELTEVGGGWRVGLAAWRRHRAKGLCKRRKSGPK